VQIGLLTPDGAPFGKAVSTQVRSAAYAHAAQWVVIAFFAALVVLMVRGALARRTAERAR
jgi:ABC-type molybdate transport system permease subunit